MQLKLMSAIVSSKSQRLKIAIGQWSDFPLQMTPNFCILCSYSGEQDKPSECVVIHTIISVVWRLSYTDLTRVLLLLSAGWWNWCDQIGVCEAANF